MREQHFFCNVDNAMVDLDWKPKARKNLPFFSLRTHLLTCASYISYQYNMLAGLKDSYDNDFKLKAATGPKSKADYDFSCDDMVMNDDRIAARLFTGMSLDSK